MFVTPETLISNRRRPLSLLYRSEITVSRKSALCLASTLGFVVVCACAKSSTSPSDSTTPSQITIGAPADSSGNGDPFGDAVPTYQQVYASSSFGATTRRITALTFPHTNTTTNNSANVITPATYTFSLSTTSRSVDGLDAATLSNNLGSDNQSVFSGSLSGTPSNLVINLTTTFTYNPSAGNLLLTIAQTGATCCGGIFFDARNGTAGGLFSRAGTGVGVTGLGITGTAGYGLVTTFTVQ